MQQTLQPQQSAGLYLDFFCVRQWAIGAGQVQCKARFAAHAIKQFLAEGICGGRSAGNAFAICKMKTAGFITATTA